MPRRITPPRLGFFRGDGGAVGLGGVRERGDVGGGERHVRYFGVQPGSGQDVGEANPAPLGGGGGARPPRVLPVPAFIQYWKSYEQLEAYARNRTPSTSQRGGRSTMPPAQRLGRAVGAAGGSHRRVSRVGPVPRVASPAAPLLQAVTHGGALRAGSQSLIPARSSRSRIADGHAAGRHPLDKAPQLWP